MHYPISQALQVKSDFSGENGCPRNESLPDPKYTCGFVD